MVATLTPKVTVKQERLGTTSSEHYMRSAARRRAGMGRDEESFPRMGDPVRP